jgi:hypothetical protein
MGTRYRWTNDGCSPIGPRDGATVRQIDEPHRTHSGHSGLAAGTALNAPYLPFAIPVGTGSVGWIVDVPRRFRVPEVTHKARCTQTPIVIFQQVIWLSTRRSEGEVSPLT